MAPPSHPPITQGIPGPDKLHLHGDTALNFKSFKRSWALYKTGSRVKDAIIRSSIWQSYLSPEAQEILESLCEENEWNNADKLLEMLQTHFNGSTNKTYERYKFNTRSQKKGETFDAFLSPICVLSQTCNYGTLNDSLFRDKIVCGTNKETTPKKLLADAKLDIDKVINICCADESAEVQATEISGTCA